MSIADSFKNFTKTIFSNPMGNTKAGTWNVLPAVLSTWSDLIQLQNQTAPDMYTLYQKQAKEYIANARKNADMIKKQETIAIRNLQYKDKIERDNDVLRVAASNSNIGGTHLDVIVRKEKLRKMNEMAVRANYANQAAMELDMGYNKAAQVYGTLYQTGRNVKWGILNAVLKGIGTYTALTTRDAKVEQNINLGNEQLNSKKIRDAAQDAYYYNGIVPTSVTPNIIKNTVNTEVTNATNLNLLSGDTVDYSNNLYTIESTPKIS